MKKLFSILIAVLCIFAYVPGIMAATNIYSDTYTTEDATGVWTWTAYETPVEIGPLAADESSLDSLTVAQTGWTFIATGDVVYTLPVASTDGLVYTFIVGVDAATIGVDVSAAAYETIVYDDGTFTTDVGDRLITPNPSVLGDSIEVICGQSGYWYVREMKGSWTVMVE